MSSGPCIVFLALSLLGMIHWGSALSPSMSDLVVGRGGGARGGAGQREPASGESGSIRDYQERERLKEEVAKELAEMVLTVIYDNPGGQSATIGRHPYMNQGLEYSVLNDMELLGNADLANSRLYSKKSFDENELAIMKTFACVLFLTTLVWAQNIEVPTDNCLWRGAKYGQMNACEPNEVVVGSCGSGRRDDCDSGQWHQLLCCKMPDYTYENCLEYKGEHGQTVSCSEQAHDDNMLMQGACGSGLQHDCGGTTHIVKCCHGHVGEAKLQSTGTCYWIYGYHGEKIQCNRPDEAAFGRCGSGYKDDCGTEKWHGLQCCQLTTDA